MNGSRPIPEPQPWAMNKAREVLGAFCPASRVRAIAALLEDTRRQALLEGLGHAREVVLEELRAHTLPKDNSARLFRSIENAQSEAIEQLQREFEQGERP